MCLNSSRHFGPANGHGAERNALVNLHDQHAADADAVHRFEIGGDAFAGDVAVQPEPIDPRLGRLRRHEKLRRRRCPRPTVARGGNRRHVQQKPAASQQGERIMPESAWRNTFMAPDTAILPIPMDRWRQIVLHSLPSECFNRTRSSRPSAPAVRSQSYSRPALTWRVMSNRDGFPITPPAATPLIFTAAESSGRSSISK